MSGVSTVTSYLIPRPIIDVFYHGYRVYSSYRENKLPHVEKMVKAILRIVLAIPFALVAWQISRVKISLVDRCIYFATYFGVGALIGYPSCTIAFVSLQIIVNVQKCVRIYPDPARKTDFVLQCVVVFLCNLWMQKYDRHELGKIDHRIRAWARKTANEWPRRY